MVSASRASASISSAQPWSGASALAPLLEAAGCEEPLGLASSAASHGFAASTSEGTAVAEGIRAGGAAARAFGAASGGNAAMCCSKVRQSALATKQPLPTTSTVMLPAYSAPSEKEEDMSFNWNHFAWSRLGPRPAESSGGAWAAVMASMSKKEATMGCCKQNQTSHWKPSS